ncbi:hypothetical protein [Vibrio harveyi]|uniref:hypothetical protein n=1 Tax=Vibrio harveyi TaxID=669 RepID=UPI001263B17E|nr:hypothetical protein [Vibrio harveyi]QFQ76879.1 hypothetical protein F9277_05125 [Vibrio harveyi]
MKSKQIRQQLDELHNKIDASNKTNALILQGVLLMIDHQVASTSTINNISEAIKILAEAVLKKNTDYIDDVECDDLLNQIKVLDEELKASEERLCSLGTVEERRASDAIQIAIEEKIDAAIDAINEQTKGY